MSYVDFKPYKANLSESKMEISEKPAASYGVSVYADGKGDKVYVLSPPVSRVMHVYSDQFIRFRNIHDLGKGLNRLGESVLLFHYYELDAYRIDDGTISRLDKDDEQILKEEYNIQIE